MLLVAAVLYWAQAILIPLALATLLAFLLSPLADLLQRWGLGRIPAVTLVVLLTVSALGAAGWGLSGQAATLLEELPRYTESLKRRIAELRPGRPLERARGALEEVVGELEAKERRTQAGRPRPCGHPGRTPATDPANTRSAARDRHGGPRGHADHLSVDRAP